MLNFNVSILPLVVLGLGNFILSWVWYSPVLFAKPWMKALGVEPGHVMTDEEKKNMPWLFVNGIVSSFLVVYGMMVIVNSLGISDFASGVLAGAVIWGAFALSHSLNTLWEGRKPIVLVINNGLFLFTYALFGGILAVWK